MEEIRILQLGDEDWNRLYELPAGIHLDCTDSFTEAPERPYDIFFLDRPPADEEIELLNQEVRAYTLFYTDKVRTNEAGAGAGTERLLRCKGAQPVTAEAVESFLKEEAWYYYPKPFGEKLGIKTLTIAHGFSGSVEWDGNYCVTLNGEFGETFHQIAFWRNNIPLFQIYAMDFWLEYDKSPDVSIVLTITKFANGSVSHVIGQWEFDEEDLKDVVQVKGNAEDGWLFLSISAKGSGELRLIALHDRVSRGKHGYFLPGGERYTASNREEVFCYFEPGDLKPPLCVYFSGYKTLQGFEGYYMMKAFGCPFLLLAEPRLEGGGFYMGEADYERLFVDCIRKYMDQLGFSADQTVLSGLSMGTFGALYYGCDIKPHAIILGKPLASIGNVAANEKYLRPGGFPTSLDVLHCQCGGLDRDSIERLNSRFWKKFDAADWGKTKFAISYMMEDDYDADAYQTLIAHLQSAGTQAYGKGLHGRHNDNTGGIVNWFVTQYKKILREDFARKTEDR